MLNKQELVVIVNGQRTTIEAEPHTPLNTIIPKALEQTGNTGQPPANWELRDAAGAPLDLSQKIEDFHFTEGVTLFLNLKAGIGG